MPTPSPSPADKFSQVGRYGTLSLLKQGNPSVVITAFGIDNEELTFGRDPDCDVRLYYNDVDLVHCKIVFEERKAFVVVLGEMGIHVDGCHVLPNDNPSRHDPTTVPLSNDSEIEIRTKRFRFTYPPKELRSVLLATPRRTSRSLRLSMINSAQVFSPRPSADPRENLRILQSPLKNTFKQSLANPSPLRARYNMYQNHSSPTPGGAGDYDDEEDDDEEEEEEEIVLVETNHPRVVQEDKDLVILEDVRVSPQKQQQQLWLQRQQQQNAGSPVPRTPQRPRSHSLHRAVLIRSVQRAVMKAEREREEEEEEEMEVLDSVVDEDNEEAEEEQDEDEEQQEEEEDERHEEHEERNGERAEAEDGVAGEGDHEVEESDSEEERPPPTQAQKSMWRKSLERIWPFKSASPNPPDADSSDSGEDEDADTPMRDEVAQEGSDREEVAESDDENDENEENAEVMEEEGDSDQENEQVLADPEPLPNFQPPPPPQPQVSTPVARRALGSFMTPQSNPANGPSRIHLTTTTAGPQRILGSQTQMQESRAAMDSPRRISMGGEPRRIPIESQRWKVRDLMIPLNEEENARTGMMADDDGVKQEIAEVFVKAESKSPVKFDSMRQNPSSGSGWGSSAGTSTAAAVATPLRGRGRKALSEEERKAIQERRRSAVKEADPFWGGGVPGLSSPMRPTPPTSMPPPSTPSGPGGGLFASFLAAASGSTAANTVSTPSGAPSSSSSGNSIFASTAAPMTATPSSLSSIPSKLRARSLSPKKLSNPILQDTIKEEESAYSDDLHMGTPLAPDTEMSAYSHSYLSSRTPVRDSRPHDGSMKIKDEDEDEMDTRSLLAKMKQTVEGMKRRRSSVVPGVLTPAGLIEDVVMGDVVANVTRDIQNAEEVPSSMSMGAPAAAVPATGTVGDQMEVDDPSTTVTGGGQEEFSLLRPAVKEELRRRSLGGGLLQSLQVQPEQAAQPQDVADVSMSSSTSRGVGEDTAMRSPQHGASGHNNNTAISEEEEAPAPPEAEESTSVVIPLPTDLPPDPDPQEEEEELHLPVAPPRRLRTPKALSKANTGGEREEGSVPAPVKHTPGRRGRKPAAAAVEEVPAAAKRGKKAVVEVAPNPAPARRVGRGGSATPASGPSSVPVSKVRRTKAVEEPPAPAESKKIVVRRGAKKVARSNAMDVDESEDEDGEDLNEEVAVKKGVRKVVTPVQPEPTTEVKKGRGVKPPATTSGAGTSTGTTTTTRMKRTPAASKAALKVAKEEMDEDAGVELSDPLDIIGKDTEQSAVDKKGKGRAQTIPAPTAARGSRTTKSVKPAEKDSTATTKARTTRAIPRSAPAKVSEKEKENVEDEEGPAKTIRVSRTKRAGGDEEIAATRSAPARTTRRTKVEEKEVKPNRTATRTRKT